MDMIHLSDAQLIEHVKQCHGNTALEELIKRYQTTVRLAINKRISNKDDIDDIVQDCFLKVITSILQGKYKENGMFKAWINRVAENMAIDHLRKKKRGLQVIELWDFNTAIDDENEIKDVFIDELMDKSPEEQVIDDEKHTALRAWIQKLPSDQKELILMRYFCDMSFRQIAEITGCNINTGLGRVRYAKQHLKELAFGKEIRLRKVV